MKDFLKKHKIVLSIATFILIGLPLFFWSAFFAIKKIQEKTDMIQKKISDNNFEKSKIEEIPKMEEANDEFENNKDSVGTIIDSNSKIDFIKYIEILAGETNNKIELKVLDDDQNNNVDIKKNIKTEAKKNKSTEEKKSLEDDLIYKQYISIQVNLTGDYQSFLNFIHKLENNKHYVNVLSFDLRKDFAENENLSTNGNLSSSGIFFSPAKSGVETKSKGEQALKSSFNIIVYIE
ncbi:MAG TPA: hypothetical protein DCS28_02510 [Candidatus Moranbacteria bacterium]|nr:hypothetical protein [Candidatus Moranbacteria bacterium]HAT74887.1 hypothetical protein [Candidatus Moranbacteria bacterium]